MNKILSTRKHKDGLLRMSSKIMDVLGNANFVVPLISFMDFECIIFQPEETLTERQLQVYAQFTELARTEFTQSSPGLDVTLEQAQELANNRECWPGEGIQRVGLALALAAGNPSYFAKLMEIIGVQLQIRALLALLQNMPAFTTGFPPGFNNQCDNFLFETAGSVPCDLTEAEQFLKEKLEQARILDEALPRLAQTLAEEKEDDPVGVYESAAPRNSGQSNDTPAINSPSPKPSDVVGGAGDEIPRTVFTTSQTESATGVATDLPPLRLLHRTPPPKPPSSPAPGTIAETNGDSSFCPKPDPKELPPPKPLPDDAISKRQRFLRAQRDQLIHMRMSSIREALAAAKAEDNNYRPRQQQQQHQPKEIRFELPEPFSAPTRLPEKEELSEELQRRWRLIKKLRTEVVENPTLRSFPSQQ